MKIKFHETLYVLVSTPTVQPTHFQALVKKGDYTYDEIIADTVNAEEIVVYDDNDEVQAIYTGYTKRIAICIVTDISIELENTDVTQALNNLANEISSMQEIQDAHTNNIAELNSNKADISAISDNVETLGAPASKSYNIGDLFSSNGKVYAVTANISKGNIIVEDGNCIETSINDEINSLKEE